MILVITATQKELSSLDLPSGTVSHVCGIGATQAGVECAYAISQHRPSLVIMAGIAGRYKASSLRVGDSVLVEQEQTADCGAFRGESFDNCFSSTFKCSYINPDWGFKSVKSYSVNVCAAPFLLHNTEVEIENMEGAAFFAAALKSKLPFLELRTISNTVDPQRGDWDIDLALNNLNISLNKLISEMENKPLVK